MTDILLYVDNIFVSNPIAQHVSSRAVLFFPAPRVNAYDPHAGIL